MNTVPCDNDEVTYNFCHVSMLHAIKKDVQTLPQK